MSMEPPMNPSTLIGMFSGLLLLAVVLPEAAEDPRLFIDLPGLGIVLLGTMAATISYPLREVLRIFGLDRYEAAQRTPVCQQRTSKNLSASRVCGCRGICPPLNGKWTQSPIRS